MEGGLDMDLQEETANNLKHQNLRPLDPISILVGGRTSEPFPRGRIPVENASSI